MEQNQEQEVFNMPRIGDAAPEFKAGLSEGKITVTEVGDIKR